MYLVTHSGEKSKVNFYSSLSTYGAPRKSQPLGIHSPSLQNGGSNVLDQWARVRTN